MAKTILLKRILFWLESSISMLVVLAVVVLLVGLIGASIFTEEVGLSLREIGDVFDYFLKIAIRIVVSEPMITITTVFWICVYIFTMRYFAQTALEKKIYKYLTPLTLVCLPICAMFGFSIAIAGLASQGAGH